MQKVGGGGVESSATRPPLFPSSSNLIWPAGGMTRRTRSAFFGLFVSRISNLAGRSFAAQWLRSPGDRSNRFTLTSGFNFCPLSASFAMEKGARWKSRQRDTNLPASFGYLARWLVQGSSGEARSSLVLPFGFILLLYASFISLDGITIVNIFKAAGWRTVTRRKARLEGERLGLWGRVFILVWLMILSYQLCENIDKIQLF